VHVFSGFLAYIAGAFLLAAALSYPAHLLLAGQIEVAPFKLVLRLAMLLMMLGLPWLLARCRVRDRQSLGYAPRWRAFCVALLKGSLLGLGIIAVPVCALIVLDVRTWDIAEPFHPAELVGVIAAGYLAGLAIAFIEETFFRGAMLSAVARQNSVLAAALACSLLYAALHFLAEAPAPETWRWNTGFIALANALKDYTEPFALVDSFAALLAAGLLLSAVRIRDGHIATCIGMHAAWVMAIKLTRWATDEDSESTYAFLVGSYDGVIGWLAAIWLGIIAWWLWRSIDSSRREALIGRRPSSSR